MPLTPASKGHSHGSAAHGSLRDRWSNSYFAASKTVKPGDGLSEIHSRLSPGFLFPGFIGEPVTSRHLLSAMHTEDHTASGSDRLNQPSIVGSKHDSAMQCANPQCSKELLYLREGTLTLLEMEPHSNGQFQSDVGAFGMRSVPSRYFWLCGECTKTLIVKRWTTAGIVLVLRNQKTAGSLPNLPAPAATSATTAATSDATSGSAHAAEGAPAPSARFACAAEKSSMPKAG